jgi:hypothetical protein
VIQTIPTIKKYDGDTMLLQAGMEAGKNVNPIQRLAKGSLQSYIMKTFVQVTAWSRPGDNAPAWKPVSDPCGTGLFWYYIKNLAANPAANQAETV